MTAEVSAPRNGQSSAEHPVPSAATLIHVLLNDRLHLDVPSHDTDLIDTGSLDSFTLVELLVNVEETFGVTIDLADFDVDDFRSVRSIAALVDRHRDTGGMPAA